MTSFATFFFVVCFTSSRDSRVPPLLLQQHSSSLQQHRSKENSRTSSSLSPPPSLSLSLSLSILFFCRLLALCAETPCLGSAARQPGGRVRLKRGGAKGQPSCKPTRTRSSGVHPASSPLCPPASLIERLVATTVGTRRLHSWKLICPLSSQGWGRKSHGIYKSVNVLSGSPFGAKMNDLRATNKARVNEYPHWCLHLSELGLLVAILSPQNVRFQTQRP